MRSYALLLSLLVARAGTQSIWSYLPTCAQSCAEYGVAAATNCDSTDYECLCETHEFHLVSTCCVRANCDEEDDNLVFSESQSLCEIYGVAITRIPDSECSSTFGVSASTATATATGSATATAALSAETFTVTDIVTDSSGPISTLTFTYSVTAGAATATATGTSSSSGDSSSGSDNDDGNSSSSSSYGTSNNEGKSSGLSEGAKIGIGVGAGVGGLAIIGGIVWLSVYCCLRRRKANTLAAAAAAAAAATSGTAASAAADHQYEKPDAAVTALYNGHKTELDAQQLQQQRPVSSLNQTELSQQQQHNPAAVASSALPAAYAGPISPIARSDNSSSSPTTGAASELQSQQQQHTYYFQSPDGGAQELSGFSSYQYHPGVVTQAEMSADNQQQQQQQQHYARYKLQ